MTTQELAKYMIDHSDEPASRIDLNRAAQLISYLDPSAGVPSDITPEAFMDAWNRCVPKPTPKTISINNGRSTCTVQEALAAVPFDAIVNAMDDDTRETVHAELAPCTDEEFLTRYLELAPFDLVIG